MIALDICESDSIDANLGKGETASAPAAEKKAPATPEQRQEVKENLTAPADNASALQIKGLKAVLKKLKDADYAKVAPVGMICRGDRQKDAEAASPTLAGLKGKRFVTMSESNEYGKLDEEKIKQLTGGEEISARALYQSAITFKPQFTLWLSCNDLPMVTDKSLFASERIKVVEFNRHFSPEEQDTHLKDELCEQSSMSGIFMWLVRGYIHYKERGLAMSGSLKSVVTKYERDNDLVLQFLENRCERVPEESSPTVIKAKDLYNAFKIWAKSEGAYILSARKFNSEMERHPEWFDRKSTSSGYATYCGLKLKEVL